MEIIERLGWRVNDLGDQLEIENWSPLGEDLVFYLDKDNLASSAMALAADFDIDEHVEALIPMRGTRGIPESISDLVGDAKEIEAMLYNLADEIAKGV